MATSKPSSAAQPGPREAGRLATRARLLAAAVSSLIEIGVARTTTLEVQRRAGASRGALLHHFPSHAQLLSATVDELVRRNERAVQRLTLRLRHHPDPVERAVLVLAATTAQPSFMAELELWAVARTDADLRAALLDAERAHRQDIVRAFELVFHPVSHLPGCANVMALTQEFLLGLALSGVLRRRPARRRQLINQWVAAARLLLHQAPG